MTIAKEEIFGPVAAIVRVDTLDEAIETINKNPFGNSAAIFTSSGKLAREFRYRVQCGNIDVNIGVGNPYGFLPFQRNERFILRYVAWSRSRSHSVLHGKQSSY